MNKYNKQENQLKTKKTM